MWRPTPRCWRPWTGRAPAGPPPACTSWACWPAAPRPPRRPGAHVARAAKFYVWSQAEAGHGCPISMTYAVVPALRHAPALAARLEPLLTACAYDPGLRPPETKEGLLAGMAMTEKQGGSDVRANTTRAEPAPSTGPGAHLLTGHKWFCSAPMCDLFLTLAYAPDGLTCFLLPRVLPGGERNGRSEEHTSELQSPVQLVCRILLQK